MNSLNIKIISIFRVVVALSILGSNHGWATPDAKLENTPVAATPASVEPTPIAMAPVAAVPLAASTVNTPLIKMAPLDTGATLFKTFGGLAVILVLIFGCAKATKLLANPLGRQQQLLQLVAVLPLGTKEKLALIEVGGKQILIGITATQINPLMELADPVKTPVAKAVNSSLSAKTANEFSKKLNEFLKAGNRQS